MLVQHAPTQEVQLRTVSMGSCCYTLKNMCAGDATAAAAADTARNAAEVVRGCQDEILGPHPLTAAASVSQVAASLIDVPGVARVESAGNVFSKHFPLEA